MEDLKAVVAKNLAECRKAAGLTQLQLAEKLNYSDKAVSKWERGESLPDVAVLCALAEMYGVTLDYLVREHCGEKPAPKGVRGRRRVLICAMSCLLVWLAATAAFSLALIFGAEGRFWLAFVWALPSCCVVCVVFACVWAGKYARTVSVSALIWSLALALFLTIRVPYMWLVFAVAAPLQILAVFWFILRGQKPKE